MNLNREKLIGDVAAELNILISKDDPVFAGVLLNQIVLNSVIDSALERIQPAITTAEKNLDAASYRLNKTIIRALDSTDKLNQSITIICWQVSAICALIALLLCFTFFSALSKYPSILLSKQDKQYLANGELMHSIWNKLDRQTKEKIREAAKSQN